MRLYYDEEILAGFKKVDHQAAKFSCQLHSYYYYIVLKSIGAPRIIIDRENFPPGLHTLTVTVTAEDGQRTISDTTEVLFQGYNNNINVICL